ncbi:MAG: hypothetical protein ACREXM_20250 [Gammaproteobacteria bacterium]
MACIRKRRGRWVLDYRDQHGIRHVESTKGNRKAAERLLAERVREIGRGTYQAPSEAIDFDALAHAFLQHAKGTTRETTFKDYRGEPDPAPCALLQRPKDPRGPAKPRRGVPRTPAR